MTLVEQILTTPDVLGEGPIWHVDEQTLYWVDIEGGAVSRWTPVTGHYERMTLGMKVGCIAFRAGGGLMVGAEHGIGLCSGFGDPVHLLSNNIAYQPAGDRFNDGAADRQGRFWAGSMSQQPINNLYRMDHDGSIHIMESGLRISNGIGFAPDDRTMYLSDSGEGVVYAYDFDAAHGTISNRREFFRATPAEGVVDGLTVDSAGYIWAAFWDGWKVVRFAADGTVDQTIQMPVQRPTSVAFGGPNLDELYVTSARVDLSDDELAGQPHAGHLFRILPGVRGLPEPHVQLDPSVGN